MKNRSTRDEIEIHTVYTVCTEHAVYVNYVETIDGHIELARFQFPQIYNLSDAQSTKIGRAAATAAMDTLSGWEGLFDRPYKVPYKAPKAVTRYVGRVGVSSLYPEKMLFECTQVTCPDNISAICISNEDGWLSAENVDTALQIFKWHSHRFYKSLEKVRKQIPRF